jgi:hypothetical protein
MLVEAPSTPQQIMVSISETSEKSMLANHGDGVIAGI